jgi:hypothetical protein
MQAHAYVHTAQHTTGMHATPSTLVHQVFLHQGCEANAPWQARLTTDKGFFFLCVLIAAVFSIVASLLFVCVLVCVCVCVRVSVCAGREEESASRVFAPRCVRCGVD